MWKLSILRLAFELQLKATMFHHNTIPMSLLNQSVFSVLWIYKMPFIEQSER